MTLISFTTNFGRPILMADLLTTSNEQGKEALIPTFFDHVDDALPPEQKSFPFGLKQKIYVIAETIALGLAGNIYQMTNYLKDIKGYFNHYPPTDENFKLFMDGYDQESINDCSIVVFIVGKIDGQLNPTIHHYGNWEEYNDPLIQVGLITGTGKQAFFKKLRQLDHKDDGIEDRRNINLTLLSLFTAEERYTMNSIVDSWGAGFELIEYSGGRFRKMDNLTYIICHSHLEENGVLINNPFLIMHYKYHGEILFINTYFGSKFKRFGVLPLDLKKEDVTDRMVPEYQGFQSDQVLCAFVIEKDDGDLFLTSVLTNPNDGYDAVSVKFEPPSPAYLEVHIAEFISEMIVEKYKKTLAK